MTLGAARKRLSLLRWPKVGLKVCFGGEKAYRLIDKGPLFLSATAVRLFSLMSINDFPVWIRQFTSKAEYVAPPSPIIFRRRQVRTFPTPFPRGYPS
jgi:hypothetical protein